MIEIEQVFYLKFSVYTVPLIIFDEFLRSVNVSESLCTEFMCSLNEYNMLNKALNTFFKNTYNINETTQDIEV